jgi:hypothetical protein
MAQRAGKLGPMWRIAFGSGWINGYLSIPLGVRRRGWPGSTVASQREFFDTLGQLSWEEQPTPCETCMDVPARRGPFLHGLEQDIASFPWRQAACAPVHLSGGKGQSGGPETTSFAARASGESLPNSNCRTIIFSI